jgi:hypothetical protein
VLESIGVVIMILFTQGVGQAVVSPGEALVVFKGLAELLFSVARFFWPASSQPLRCSIRYLWKRRFDGRAAGSCGHRNGYEDQCNGGGNCFHIAYCLLGLIMD